MNKSTLWVAATIILLVISVGLGVVYHNNQRKCSEDKKTLASQMNHWKQRCKHSPSVSQKQETTNKSASSQESQDEFKGWKTYENSQYHFSVRYPATWSQSSISVTDQYHLVTFESPKKYGSSPDEYQYRIEISAIPNKGSFKASFLSAIGSENNPEFDLSVIPEKIKKYKVFSTDDRPGVGGYLDKCFERGDHFICFTFSPYVSDEYPYQRNFAHPETEEYLETFLRVLQSVQFSQ